MLLLCKLLIIICKQKNDLLIELSFGFKEKSLKKSIDLFEAIDGLL